MHANEETDFKNILNRLRRGAFVEYLWRYRILYLEYKIQGTYIIVNRIHPET